MGLIHLTYGFVIANIELVESVVISVTKDAVPARNDLLVWDGEGHVHVVVVRVAGPGTRGSFLVGDGAALELVSPVLELVVVRTVKPSDAVMLRALEIQHSIKSVSPFAPGAATVRSFLVRVIADNRPHSVLVVVAAFAAHSLDKSPVWTVCLETFLVDISLLDKLSLEVDSCRAGH